MKTITIILFPILLSSQVEIIKIDTLYLDFGIEYTHTKIHIGKDTLIAKCYKDKTNQYVKFSNKLTRRRLDSIKRVLRLKTIKPKL